MNPRRRSVALVALLLTGCATQTAGEHNAAAPGVETAPPRTTPSEATTGRGTTTTLLATTTTTIAGVGEPQTDAPTVPQTPTLPVPQAPPDPAGTDAPLTLGTIEIPRIGLNRSLFEGITISTFDKGPGHWPGTALPGELGNVVVGGHRTSKARPFRHLEQLQPGDEVIFTTDAGRFVYHVVRTEIVKPDAMWIITQTEAYTATLFACNPVGSTKERIVVLLELSV